MADASGWTGRDSSTAQPRSGRPRRASLLVLLGLVFGSGPWSGAGAQVLSGELAYTAVQPCRIFDTRIQAAGPLAAGTGRTFHVVGSTSNFTAQGGKAGGCGIPGFVAGEPQAVAVMINLIAVGPQGPGNLRAFPTDSPSVPLASVINYTDVNLANGFVLPLRQDSEGSDVLIRADVSGTHVVADVMGFFGPATPRRYYLTRTTHRGAEATTACAAGFHMATLWEIFDVTSLHYDLSQGLTDAGWDHTAGPTTSTGGWIRTAWDRAGSSTPGVGNCWSFTSSSSGVRGTWVRLMQTWTAPATAASPWEAFTFTCDLSRHVWCVEDQ